MTEFYGYERSNGSIGIRNKLLVLTPVNCSYEPAKRIAAQVDNAISVTQNYSCEFDEMISNTLIGIGCNPNIAGVLIIGLGCESLTSEILAEGIKPTGKPVEILIIQKEGGTLKTIEKGTRILQKMALDIANIRRKPFPLSKLTLAIQCGGSDTTSGLVGNPATGVAVDMLIDEGGTAIFTETMEMIGTEQVLSKRAINNYVAKSIYKMIKKEEQRMKAMGIDSRFMSKGNINGGLTTIEEKSLGAIIKGGTSQIQGVLENSRRILEKPTHNGLWLQDGSGEDVISMTHQIAVGAQMVAFITGRGSCVGHAIAPVIKITGNSQTYKNMVENIDINAGTILEGSESLHDVGEKIFKIIVDVASGSKTKAEILNYQDFGVFIRDRIAEQLLRDLYEKNI